MVSVVSGLEIGANEMSDKGHCMQLQDLLLGENTLWYVAPKPCVLHIAKCSCSSAGSVVVLPPLNEVIALFNLYMLGLLPCMQDWQRGHFHTGAF